MELARDWRTDRVLRRLEAMLLVGDVRSLLMVSGNGDVIEPDDGVAAIGSGGSYALAAARALVAHSALSAEEVVRESLRVASEICIYTNDRINPSFQPNRGQKGRDRLVPLTERDRRAHGPSPRDVSGETAIPNRRLCPAPHRPP